MFESLLMTAVLIAAPSEKTVPTPPPVVATKNDPNQTGVQRSAYTGKFFIKTQEPYRKCVGQREGRHQYWITGSNGYYESTYQMTDALVRGAAWMLYPEMKQWWGKETAREVRDQLLNTRGSKWNRFYMDAAFYTILNWNGPGSGAKHWRGGRYGCEVGMKHWGGAR